MHIIVQLIRLLDSKSETRIFLFGDAFYTVLFDMTIFAFLKQNLTLFDNFCMYQVVDYCKIILVTPARYSRPKTNSSLINIMLAQCLPTY